MCHKGNMVSVKCLLVILTLSDSLLQEANASGHTTRRMQQKLRSLKQRFDDTTMQIEERLNKESLHRQKEINIILDRLDEITRTISQCGTKQNVTNNTDGTVSDGGSVQQSSEESIGESFTNLRDVLDLKSEVGSLLDLKTEMSDLKTELGSLSDLKAEMGSLSDLKMELGSLSALKAEMDSLFDLKTKVGSLSDLKIEVGSLSDLKTKLGSVSNFRTEVIKMRNKNYQEIVQLYGDVFDALQYNMTQTLQQYNGQCWPNVTNKQPDKTTRESFKPNVTTKQPDKTTHGSFRPKSCQETSINGIVSIYPDSIPSGLKVYCDQDTDGGGWMVFQRRKDGSVHFNRGWDEFKNGFGDLKGEFWLGNEYLHKLTTSKDKVLRIDMNDFQDNTAYAQYKIFQIGTEEDKFRLTVGEYSGTAGDSLSESHNGMLFSTKSVDNDESNINCAERFVGAWWFHNCFDAHLNGMYQRSAYGIGWKGIMWNSWRIQASLKFVEIKIR